MIQAQAIMAQNVQGGGGESCVEGVEGRSDRMGFFTPLHQQEIYNKLCRWRLCKKHSLFTNWAYKVAATVGSDPKVIRATSSGCVRKGGRFNTPASSCMATASSGPIGLRAGGSKCREGNGWV